VTGATVDGRADLYAAGVIIAEMVLGAHPMEGRGVLPPMLEPIVRRCLESDRERRYPSARDLAADLERAAASLHAPSSSSVPTADVRAGLARWWWQFHQALAAVAYWLMVVPAWYGRLVIGGRTGRALFFTTLAALLLASILRLHLWFTLRTSPAEFTRQRHNERWWIHLADALFVSSLMAMGALVADSQMALAVLLVSVAIGAAVIAAFIEPSTARAAFPASFD
jgi:hypothetical protein